MPASNSPGDVETARRVLHELNINPSSLAPLEQDQRILTLTLPGGEVTIGAWKKLRQAVDRTGRWPIVGGDPKELRLLTQFEMAAASASEVLEQVPAGNPLDALDLDPDDWTGDALDDLAAADSDEDLDWSTPPQREFSLSSAFDILSRKPLELCLMALLPTTQPADAPAYLHFGGWNACPEPRVHVAFLRDWGKRFGAVPAAITGDVIECFVSKPPETPDEARALANEQVRYCGDIVFQGTETVDRLAYELWRSPHWYFWWD